MHFITKEEFESATSSKVKSVVDPSPTNSKSSISSASDWKVSAAKKSGRSMRVGQGLGKKLNLIKTIITPKKTALRRKSIKKPKRKKVFNRKTTSTFTRTDFHCDECNEDFVTGQALGGHMSRVHPGKSESYAKKVERRKERAFDRELLRLAKIKHTSELGEGANLDRVKIRRYKKQLRAKIENGEGDEVEGYNPDTVFE